MAKNRLRYIFGSAMILILVCLAACSYQEQPSENRAENAIQDMKDHEVVIKYVNGNDRLYYQITADAEFIQQLDLQNWQLKEADDTLTLDEYLVVRIAENYEIVIYSNQVGKIYDYYGTYGTNSPESLFYETALKLQAIIDYLDMRTTSNPSCNIGFEN
jgi:hypothetical protein